MTDPKASPVPKPRAREPRPKAEAKRHPASIKVNVVDESSTQSRNGTPDPEGEKKSGPAVPGTGAGATFSGKPVPRGGVKRGTVAPERALGAQDAAAGPVEAPEGSEPSGALRGANAKTPMQVGGHTWAEAPAEGDPGPGFYRFRAADIPDFEGRPGGLRTSTVEVFGRDLAAARLAVGHLVAKAKRSSPVRPVDVRPTHHRATRLSKKHRREIG